MALYAKVISLKPFNNINGRLHITWRHGIMLLVFYTKELVQIGMTKVVQERSILVPGVRIFYNIISDSLN